MDKLNCPHCGCDVLNDPRLAGQVVSCPNCRKPFRMPEGPPVGGAFGFEPSTPAAPPGPGSVSPPFPGPQETGARKPHPTHSSQASTEPWYYGSLDKYAMVLMWLGIAQAAIALVIIIFLTVVTILNEGSILTAIATLIAGLFGIFLFLVVFFFTVALIRLAVDMGRNLRAIRQNTESK